ncbi:MAG: glycosyltransferase [Thermofilaceae archaeon]
MGKVVIYTSEKGVSLKKVAHHIGDTLASAAGAEVRYVYGPDISEDRYADADAVLIAMPFDVVWALPYFYVAWRAWYLGKPYAYYTTIEGDVRRTSLPYWVIRDLDYVANSEYTMEKLHSVSARVIGVVHHGVDPESIRSASGKAKRFRSTLLRGAKHLVGYIASGHTRKCHKLFAKAVRIVSERNRDVRFAVVTDEKGAKHYADTGATVIQRFGSMSEEDIYAFINALDVYVQASCSEGFGLPLLEALTAGKVVVSPDYKPLTEFTREGDAVLVPVHMVETVDEGGGILYELNLYEPQDMADAVLEAVERAARGEVPDASYYAEEFNYRKVYSWFARYLGLT